MAPALPSALLLLLLLLSPGATHAAPALTVPPNGISGCSVWLGPNGVQSQAASPQITPTPDGLDVALGATASDGATFPGLYIGSFSADCALLGAGSLGYGGASGTLSVTASSTPDSLPPDPAHNAGNDPLTNNGYARGEGLLTLQFDDTGVVTSSVLPNGTPVQLDFTFLLESVGVTTGGAPVDLLFSDATYFVHAAEADPPFASVDWILFGNDLVTRPLATAVGRKIDVQGKLTLHVRARAGREVPGATYYGDLDAAIDASNTSSFTIATPENVTFVTESGHDYAAPAPSEALLLATGALVLAVAGWRRPATRAAAPARTRP